MKSVIVLGMHRSRTSLVAKILIELGVFMGHAFRKPDEANPYGYWEDLAWRNINKTLLNASGHTWYNPPPITCDVNYGLRIDATVMIDALQRRRNVAYDVWGFKDPRTILNIQLFHSLLDNPHYVVMSRDRWAIIDSLNRRASFRGYSKSSSDWDALCQAYEDHLRSFLSSGNNLKVHHIDSIELTHYDSKVQDALQEQEVKRLADFIGVKPPDDFQEFMQSVSGNKI